MTLPVLRFGNLEDIIIAKEGAILICSLKISKIHVDWQEYELDGELPAEEGDLFIKNLEKEIDEIEKEKELIRAEIKSLQAEILYRKSQNPKEKSPA